MTNGEGFCPYKTENILLHLWNVYKPKENRNFYSNANLFVRFLSALDARDSIYTAVSMYAGFGLSVSMKMTAAVAMVTAAAAATLSCVLRICVQQSCCVLPKSSPSSRYPITYRVRNSDGGVWKAECERVCTGVQLHTAQCIALAAQAQAHMQRSFGCLCIGWQAVRRIYACIQKVKEERGRQRERRRENFYHVHHIGIAFCRSCASDLTCESHRCDVFIVWFSCEYQLNSTSQYSINFTHHWHSHVIESYSILQWKKKRTHITKYISIFHWQFIYCLDSTGEIGTLIEKPLKITVY